MIKLPIQIPIHAVSEIWIEKGLFEKASGKMAKKWPRARFFIVTNDNLYKVYRSKIKTNFPKASIITLPAGEETKSIKGLTYLSKKLLQLGCNRHDILVGFGGGVITDLVNFTASIYMRGIRCVLFPISLLGMVDAALGGKSGIDFEGKNLLGSVYLPELVLIDPNFLKTLPEKQFQIGMAEVVKYGAIWDPSIWKDLKKKPINIMTILEKAIAAKVHITSKDLHESGLRKILNYGHTFGHAIEAASRFKVSHGEAIAIGMMISNHVAQKLKKQPKAVGEQVKAMLELFSLPTKLPRGITMAKLKSYLSKDKKIAHGSLNFIIVPKVGKTEILPIPVKKLFELAQDFR